MSVAVVIQGARPPQEAAAGLLPAAGRGTSLLGIWTFRYPEKAFFPACDIRCGL
jgi:hypothetical protein